MSRGRLPRSLLSVPPAALLALVVLVTVAGPAGAHPLGNFTTNTYAGLVVTPDTVMVDYVVDLAEIPALRLVQRLDTDDDGSVSDAEGAGYADEECQALAGGMTLAVDGRPLDVGVGGTSLAFRPGEGGLSTSRLECDLVASGGAEGGGGTREVTFADANLEGRVGWREVTARGEGVTLVDSDVPAATISDSLRAYPEDRLESPLDVRSAALTVREGGGTSALVPIVPPDSGLGQGLERLATAFTDLVAVQRLTAGFAALAVALAVGLGALHALAPGHGKTVMAAYLVSREGTARQALALAVTVAVTHTAGVLLLGAVLTVTEVVTPERLYGWLGLASGLLFAAVGLTLLRSALARRGQPHDHSHGHSHGDSHGHGHGHGARAGEHAPHGGSGSRDETEGAARRGVRWGSLVAPGLAGGLVPTPSALIVLLGGIALGRAWFGVALVAAYGVGMGAVLVGAGWLLLRARGSLVARSSDGRFARVMGALPVLTAWLVVVAGVVIAGRAALTVL